MVYPEQDGNNIMVFFIKCYSIYRIRFYQLRLAKSAIFSPRLHYYQEAVDTYIRSREEESYNRSFLRGLSNWKI